MSASSETSRALSATGAVDLPWSEASWRRASIIWAPLVRETSEVPLMCLSIRVSSRAFLRLMPLRAVWRATTLSRSPSACRRSSSTTSASPVNLDSIS